MTKPETPTTPLTITELRVANVKRIKVADVLVSPETPVVVVGGGNGEGKSSLLDSIAYGLGSARIQPPKVIREGQTEASVEIHLGEDMVITRTWEDGGRGTLEVRNADGVPQKSPQALLDSLTGRYSFDPLAFLGLKPGDQAEQVRIALGLDFSKLDVEHADKFSERTVINREIERAKARLIALPKAPAADAATAVDLQSLLAEQDRLQAIQRGNDKLSAAVREAAAKRNGLKAEFMSASAAIERTRVEMKAAEEAVSRLKQAIADGELNLKGLEERGKKSKDELEAAEKNASSAEDVELPLADVKSKLEEAQAMSEASALASAKAKERELLAADVKKKESESEALTKRLDGIEAEKSKLLQAAKFPVEGLEYTYAGLRFRGVPFEQASQAERLRVAVAMGLASNPRLRVLLVREGSLLDSKSTALLAEIAAEHDAQVWLEVVGTDGKGPCIIIEDGSIAEVRT